MRCGRARSRRLGAGLACLLAGTLVGSVTPAAAVDHFFQGSVFCDRYPPFRGTAAVVDGPSSQLSVHTQVFGPAFAAACPSGSGLLTYLGTGERAGLDAILDHVATRHFGTSDVPFSAAEWLQAWFDLHARDRRNRTSTFGVHQIPMYVNVLAVGYSLTSCKVGGLNLSSPVLSLIFSGQITEWNDPLILRDNPSESALASCAYPIRVIKRAEFAGSTFTFKDYLSKRNPIWEHYKQPAENQLWPSIANACPALGEDGMADCIISTRNSIGYIQYHEARVRGVRTARVDSAVSAVLPDQTQHFLAPSAAGCTEAASSAANFPPQDSISVGPYATPVISPTAGDWSTVSLTDGPRGYPMCSFSYAILFQEIQHAYSGQYYPFGAARTSVDYLWIAVGDGAQGRLPPFDYGMLPPNIIAASRAGLEALRFQS